MHILSNTPENIVFHRSLVLDKLSSSLPPRADAVSSHYADPCPVPSNWEGRQRLHIKYLVDKKVGCVLSSASRCIFATAPIGVSVGKQTVRRYTADRITKAGRPMNFDVACKIIALYFQLLPIQNLITSSFHNKKISYGMILVFLLDSSIAY